MHAGVVTPEAVLLELPTAGVATRAFARLVDLGVQAVVALVLGWAMVPLARVGMSPVLITLLLVFLVLLAWPIALEVLWRGRSVGKALFGLRVVGRDGAPEAPRQSVVRGLVALVDIYLSLGFLALVTAMFNPSSQRPGDVAAGTVVISERGRSAVHQPIAFHPPPGFEHYVASLDVGSLDEEDFSLIRSFLLRVRELRPDARMAQSVDLAVAVGRRIHHPPPPDVDPQLWLVCVASAYQLRRGGLLADAALGLAPLAPVPAWVPSSPAARRRGR